MWGGNRDWVNWSALLLLRLLLFESRFRGASNRSRPERCPRLTLQSNGFLILSLAMSFERRLVIIIREIFGGFNFPINQAELEFYIVGSFHVVSIYGPLFCVSVSLGVQCLQIKHTHDATVWMD